MKKWIGTFAVAAVGAATGFGIMNYFSPVPEQNQFATERSFIQPAVQVVQPSTASNGTMSAEAPDFIKASATSTPAVVHIKSYFKKSDDDPFGGVFGNPFHGGGSGPQAAGSGVIISSTGYITTNNHVINNADKVEVILEDKRSYEARVVGTDPTTDLALLKIQATEDLPFLSFANSNDVQVGEWVLAVGNPFNLTSTVTAGIVSAKGRSLNLLNEEFAIESFIQTDAAVNPGNSGGALINTSGQLVGINTAIASETGSYAGYSFAVPVNIVRKVMEDLKGYGEVQRGIIGVQIRNINAQFAEDRGLDVLQGAYVTGTISGGAAEAAGIRSGDVIARVNQSQVNSASELQEVIGTFRPGDKVQLKVIRDNEPVLIDVILRNREGKTSLGQRIEDQDVAPEKGIVTADEELGAALEEINFKDKFSSGLEAGVKITALEKGLLMDAGLEEGFIITRVNKEYVDSPRDVQKLIADSEGSILIEGLNSEGQKKFYAFEQ